MSDIADAGTAPPPPMTHADRLRAAARAQMRAAMRFAAEVAPEAPAVAWFCQGRHDGLYLVDDDGKPRGGGLCAVSSAGSRRPALVAFERCETPEDARRIACIIAHEVAHLIQATKHGGCLPTSAEAGPTHERATWFEACSILSRRLFDVEEIGEGAHIGQWPHVLSQVMEWRAPFVILVAGLSIAATSRHVAPEAAA